MKMPKLTLSIKANTCTVYCCNSKSDITDGKISNSPLKRLFCCFVNKNET